ncbi:MAG TPA: hypothetical protein VKQ72_19175, partial [Aggregatilineales bacterium]|nr:hypothetical protein [Aggregatilineales bacterium]
MAEPTMPELCSQYDIPRYAQELLFLVCRSQVAQLHGSHGTYSLDKLDDLVELHFGRADGPTLALWQDFDDPTALAWDGQIKVGGFVERLH